MSIGPPPAPGQNPYAAPRAAVSDQVGPDEPDRFDPYARRGRAHEIRPNSSEQLLPPKPNELLIT